MTGAGRPRLLLAPVTASPTKPLTPSHLKLLLAADVLHRATATYADVTFLYRPLAHAGSRQIAGFWEHLDRTGPAASYTGSTEEQIGSAYQQFQQLPPAPYADVEPFVRRAADGWAHPASRRILDVWSGHYRTLGMTDPGLTAAVPRPVVLDDLVRLLVEHHLCIDGRPLGAPVYLDATAAGLPLRTAVTADGHANYLMSTLGEIVPLLPSHDHVVLAHDVELRADYRTIAHILGRLGARVSRIEFPRVPINGVARAARHGDWRNHTLGVYAPPLIEEFGAAAFALGMRCYLVAGLSRTRPESFTAHDLRRWVRRAVQLLDRHAAALQDPASAAVAALARRLAGRQPYVDPHRCVAAALGRDPTVPAAILPLLIGAADRPPVRDTELSTV